MGTYLQGLSERYGMMSNDDLLRVAADRGSLMTAARRVLSEELQKRGLDTADAIHEYEGRRDQRIKEEEEPVAAVRWANRSRFQIVFDHLKQHPLLALLASISSPALAFFITYGIVTLRVGNGRILSCLVSLALALGGVCGVAACRSATPLPIRVLGFLTTLGEFFYAFGFLFNATIGFR